LVALDEAHKLRNTETKRHGELEDVITSAPKRILATATTKYNHPADIAPLVNLAAGGEKVLPLGNKEFENKYIEKIIEQPPLLKRILGAPPKEKFTLKNKGELKKKLQKYVDHYDLNDDPNSKDKFPSKEEHVIEVPMSKRQYGIYKYYEGQLPWHLRMKVRMNLPLDRRDAAQLNAFSSSIRQVSNSLEPFTKGVVNHDTTPKIERATSELEKRYRTDKNFRGLVYSNYLGAGLNDYSHVLTSKGIPHAMFTGALSAKEKDKIKNDYNEGKVPVLLVSSSGAEGLDLKGTKLTQVLEPHWNHSKIKQIKGRGVRYESHSHLPPEERHVEIQHYISRPPDGWLGKAKTHSIDQYLLHNSKNKEGLDDEMKSLVKSAMTRWKLVGKAEEIAKKLKEAGADEGFPVKAFAGPKEFFKRHGDEVLNQRALEGEIFGKPYAREFSYLPNGSKKRLVLFSRWLPKKLKSGEAGF
jgi:SNF2 family DNA or RNA helicase